MGRGMQEGVEDRPYVWTVPYVFPYQPPSYRVVDTEV